MKIYDISVPVEPQMHIYPGDPGMSIERVVEVGEESTFALSRLVLGTHTGTHVDPPSHFYPDGISADSIPLETLVGPVRVIDVGEARAVMPEDVDRLPERTERVLFKSRNGAIWEKPKFQRRFTYIDPEAARLLASRRMKLVGIDYLSAEQYGAREPLTHWALLGAGTIILEGLDLREVPEGEYLLVCLPLKIVGADGAPARAVLIDGGLP